MSITHQFFLMIAALCSISSTSLTFPTASGADYAPLTTSGKVSTETYSLVDTARSRTIPLRFYLPENIKPQPVVLFSHGLGGSCDNNRYLGEHLAGRGFVCIFLQHPGSDESVWKGKKPAEIMPAMQQAANYENLKLRCEDVKALVGALAQWNKLAGHPLKGRMDLDRIGMSGHSFGAQTTQGVLGQGNARVGNQFKVPEITGGIAYSPSIPLAGSPQEAFRRVDRPLLLMTGTKDDSPVGGQTPESRRKVYPALPDTIDRYELVLDGAEHSVFSEREPRLRTLRGTGRNPNHHKVILSLSTAFWDCYLRDDENAKKWLQGDGAKAVLEQADQWQFATRN